MNISFGKVLSLIFHLKLIERLDFWLIILRDIFMKMYVKSTHNFDLLSRRKIISQKMIL